MCECMCVRVCAFAGTGVVPEAGAATKEETGVGVRALASRRVQVPPLKSGWGTRCGKARGCRGGNEWVPDATAKLDELMSAHARLCVCICTMHALHVRGAFSLYGRNRSISRTSLPQDSSVRFLDSTHALPSPF